MIQINWQNDNRDPMPAKYTTDWHVDKGRLSAFLRGWTNWVKYGHHPQDVLHWQTMGALYASTFGSREKADQILEVVRCELYHVALLAYVHSQRCAHWTDEQRAEALRLSWEEVERRGGCMLK